MPSSIQNVRQLEELLSEPPASVVEVMRHLEGDVVFLGAGGKIGPSLARMARRASDLAATKRRVMAVSRFSDPNVAAGLAAEGVETIHCDLLDESALTRLPQVPNVLYLAGLKFGSTGNAPGTWAMNTFLPALVCRQFPSSRIVAFSTGAVYGLAAAAEGGSRETDLPQPVGEYAMSCLGRERMFQYFSQTQAIPTVLVRLFYACELRYGVLVDLAGRILAGEPIDLRMGCFNTIWQGDSNAMTLLSFARAATPPFIINVTGPETLSTREVAEAMGRRLGMKPTFCGAELPTACLGNTTLSRRLFGPPRVSAAQLIEWVADWTKRGGENLLKPTHFEVRDGKY